MMDFEDHGFVDIGNSKLEYRWVNKGAEENPVLILLHEGLGSVGMWKDFPDRLSELTKCNVFVYSRFGYGKSDPVSLPRPLSYMHDEGLNVLSVLLEMFDEDLILIGHSDGASIALINVGSIPNRKIKGLVVMAPHVFTENVCIESIQLAKELYGDTNFRNRLARYHDDVDVAFKGWCDAWLDPGFLDWDIKEYLSGIKIPVLIIQGADDEYGTVAQVDAIRALIQAPSEYHCFTKCKHSPHRDQATLTVSVIDEFLNKLRSGIFDNTQ